MHTSPKRTIFEGVWHGERKQVRIRRLALWNPKGNPIHPFSERSPKSKITVRHSLLLSSKYSPCVPSNTVHRRLMWHPWRFLRATADRRRTACLSGDCSTASRIAAMPFWVCLRVSHVLPGRFLYPYHLSTVFTWPTAEINADCLSIIHFGSSNCSSHCTTRTLLQWRNNESSYSLLLDSHIIWLCETTADAAAARKVRWSLQNRLIKFLERRTRWGQINSRYFRKTNWNFIQAIIVVSGRTDDHAQPVPQ